MRSSVDGVSLVLVYLTARSAVCHWARVAVAPELTSVRTPPVFVLTAMLPIVPGAFAKERTSSLAEWLPATVTVAEARVVLSTSVTVSPVSIATGVEVALSASVHAVVPDVLVSTGASSVAVRVMVRLAAVPVEVASVAANARVRLLPVGVLLVLS